ncbi:hypothetical protein F2P81_014042 [Scophthalmus maximus]|uniref:Uncharacterized protein n=1 Tax=Scophthalmus maximus TaxID=52904 RepID=A0A6A4SFP5_SCOMX|nr:hypothetical protein F2P81_014042 [Scophthalmus maximus]
MTALHRDEFQQPLSVSERPSQVLTALYCGERTEKLGHYHAERVRRLIVSNLCYTSKTNAGETVTLCRTLPQTFHNPLIWFNWSTVTYKLVLRKEVAHTMLKNDGSGDDSQRDSQLRHHQHQNRLYVGFHTRVASTLSVIHHYPSGFNWQVPGNPNKRLERPKPWSSTGDGARIERQQQHQQTQSGLSSHA